MFPVSQSFFTTKIIKAFYLLAYHQNYCANIHLFYEILLHLKLFSIEILFFPDFGNYFAFMTFSKLLYWLSIRYELVEGDLGDARRFYNGPKSHLWCSEIRLYEPNLNFQAKFSILKPLQQWDSWTQKTIRTIKNRTIYQTSQLPILIIRHLQNRLFNGDAFPKSGAV